MKPRVLLIEPMMAEVESRPETAYCLHRLFAAPTARAINLADDKHYSLSAYRIACF